MSEPAQLDSLIKQRVQEAVSTAQNDNVYHMDTIIKSIFDAFQKSTNENQRQLSEIQLAKIEEMNSDNYVFKRKGNEEQFKVNSKVANKMKEARFFLREDSEQTEQTQKGCTKSKLNVPRNNVPVQRPGKCYECGIPGHWRFDHQTGAFGEVMQRNKNDKISKHVNSFDETVDSFDSFDKLKVQFQMRRIHNSSSLITHLKIQLQSDDSSIGFGGYAVSISDTEVMGSWNSVESLKSSTWKELKAVYRVLLSLIITLQGETIKWYPDNQNIVYIIRKGSRNSDLQLIGIKIANVCKLNNIVLLLQ
ncbi:unnamed protein product [Mytilus coruscus]|uniref:RNase H type-1 domain-containing protein n=1 Tax=Mytilus coruscus TaxID=42192 RepID=A0A6J8D2U4_MYTCO|nr:unnamed protein product [Mytilus coruscus]